MKETVHTPNAPKAVGPYSQAVIANGFVFTAGQIAIDPSAGAIVASDIAGQTRQTLANLQAILEAAGSSVSAIVKTTIFVTDIQRFAAVNAAYAEFFAQEGVNDPPARATVEVSALPLNALVEIDATALLQV